MAMNWALYHFIVVIRSMSGFFEYNVPAKTGKRHRLLYAVRK